MDECKPNTSIEIKVRRARAKKQSLAVNPFSLGRGGSHVFLGLGSRTILIQKPIPGAVYTKNQCLHIIKNSTVKGSKDRGRLIKYLVEYEFVPSKSDLYRLLQKDEKGGLINNSRDDNWGMTTDENLEQQSTPLLGIYSDLSSILHNLPPSLPPVSKKPIPIGLNSFVRYGIAVKRGWEGRLRLRLIPFRFDDNDCTAKEIQFIDICEYIGSSDIQLGKRFGDHHFDEDVFHRSGQRVHDIYFSFKDFPPSDDLDSGGSNETFCKLKTYIELASHAEGSPVRSVVVTERDISKISPAKRINHDAKSHHAYSLS